MLRILLSVQPTLLLLVGSHKSSFVGISLLQVVGGMTWCITVCDFDVDVDLLFQENSTIGQKM